MLVEGLSGHKIRNIKEKISHFRGNDQLPRAFLHRFCLPKLRKNARKIEFELGEKYSKEFQEQKRLMDAKLKIDLAGKCAKPKSSMIYF